MPLNVENLLLWSRLRHQAAEVQEGDRRFQYNGDPRMGGVWERYFHSDSHPTRRRVRRQEAEEVLSRASEFFVADIVGDAEFTRLSRVEMEKAVEEIFSS